MAKLNKVQTQDKNFTRVFNEVIKDTSLSWKARGIFIYLWSLPDDWNFRENYIETQASDGMSSLRSGLHELERNHYLLIQYHANNPKVPVGDSHWYISDKKMLNFDFRGSKIKVQSSKFDNQNLPTTNKQTTKELTTDLTNNTDNGKPNIRQMIVKDLESLMVNINTFVAQEIDYWIKNYDPKLILKAIHQVGSTSPSPTWVVKDISTQLSRGCQVHQPRRHMNYGNKSAKRYLPDWAKKGYHQKLHPTDKKTQEKIKEQLKELNKKDGKK